MIDKSKMGNNPGYRWQSYNIVYQWLCLLLIFLFPACNKETAFDCVKSTGAIIRQERLIPVFHSIILKDNIDLNLVNQTDRMAVIEAGKNLLSKVYLQASGDTLIISNGNHCNWARSLKNRITVTLSIPKNELLIVHRGYGEIKSTDTLRTQRISIYSLDAGGNIDLQAKSNAISVYSNSHAQVNMSGYTTSLYIWLHKGISRINTENMPSDYCTVQHEGSNEVRVFPVTECNVEIYENGDVVYYNEPVKMNYMSKGSGKLRKR